MSAFQREVSAVGKIGYSQTRKIRLGPANMTVSTIERCLSYNDVHIEHVLFILNTFF